MIENVITCDKCGRKIKDNTYFTVDIYGHDVNPSVDGRTSTNTMVENVNNNLIKIFGQERHYCEKCKEEIKRFCMNNDELNTYLRREEERKIREDKCKRCPYIISCSLGLMNKCS